MVIDLLNGTGGSTKISALLGNLDGIIKSGHQIKNLSGVSASSILFSSYAMGQLDKARPIILNMNDETIWGKKSNKPGSIASIFRGLKSIVTGKNPYLGDMVGLRNHLNNIITPEVFKTYKNNDEAPNCFVGAVRDDGESKVWNLKEADDSIDAVDKVMASSSIPFMTKPVTIYGRDYIDGGAPNDHSIGERVIPLLLQKNVVLKNICTIFTRPKGFPISPRNLMETGLLKFLMHYISKLVVKNTSVSDERVEELLCKLYKLNYYPLYTPYFAKSLYDTSKETTAKGYNIGLEESEKIK